jgi:spore germination protein
VGTNKLAPVQMLTITVSATLGVRILMIQQDIVSLAGRDGWISMLLGGVVILASALLVMYPLAEMYPDKDFPLMLLDVLGKYIGRVFLIPVCIAVLLSTGLSVRIFVYAIKLFLLDDTPSIFIVLVTVLCTVYVISLGPKVIGASVDFMFPVYLVPLLFLIIASISEFETLNMLPILHNNTLETAKAAVPAFGSMVGYGIVLYFLCYVSGNKSSKKWYAFGILLSVFLYTVLTASTISTFEPDEIKRMVFPTLDLSHAIEFPATLVERLEALVVIIWIPGIFAWIILFGFASVRNLSALLGLKHRHNKYATYGHIPLLYLIAVFPKSGVYASEYLKIVENAGIIITLVFVTFLYITAVIKRRRKSTWKRQ